MTSLLQSQIDRRGSIRTIGVIGMGYVGIPAAVLFADVPQFAKVYGFQRASPSSGYKIEMLNGGKLPLKGEEPGLEDLIKKTVDAGTFHCTADFSKIADCDAVTLAIQTPFANPKDLIPDFRPLEEGLRQTGRYLAEGTLVVLESTITPGTTTGMAREILEEESGLAAGVDFALAHAPERVMVGRLLKNIREHDRIVGGIDDVSTRRAIELYAPVLTLGRIIPMTATAAEVTKTAENALRDLQIAAANQLALHCEAMGVNVYDVRAGVDSLKGDGITRAILWPGAGVGGHCLTKDTWHLERGAQMMGGDLDYPHGADSIFGVARAINDFMPRHMAALTEAGLERAGKSLAGAKVALLGWAFIKNSGDARNTPAEPFYDLMQEAGATVTVHDPYVEDDVGIPVETDFDQVLAGADAVVVFTGHDCYASLDPARVKQVTGHSRPVIVDGRNVLDPDAFIAAGFVYKGIGRGDKNSHPVDG
ncbi:nucleotide sugar dehydrogenase [Methanoculleus sp. FWC-SCC1]|uniref:UDP-N-acetyl-D-mannosamine dehydrogenase n=1 Tax=Methanoculleus frigidifontis TaxID=2584085 RepID=A0ABT8MBW5_9EURY|nr:nucleotide sugar dehydrogenase [Methanoculleus sp. FWC-SCC1]MDN7025427.1 nucleotide sugar dehydrogenase [Methanoculleus sp. FWC-SCC1]